MDTDMAVNINLNASTSLEPSKQVAHKRFDLITLNLVSNFKIQYNQYFLLRCFNIKLVIIYFIINN